jgi:hypothetical protein
MTQVTTNKQLLQTAFAEMAKGNTKPFVDTWADDFCWTCTGTTRWSRTYRGKQSVLNDLFKPLYAKFEGRYSSNAQRFVAEDDIVVVECRGDVMMKSGKRYANTYCFVCRFEGGKMRELTEYLDTELVTAALCD